MKKRIKTIFTVYLMIKIHVQGKKQRNQEPSIAWTKCEQTFPRFTSNMQNANYIVDSIRSSLPTSDN